MRVLVTGAGRSGTTWTGEVLGQAPGAGFISEPDNPNGSAFASLAARGLGLIPAVELDGEAPKNLTRLFDVAFGAPVRTVRGQYRLGHALLRSTTVEQRRAVMHPTRPKVTLRLRAANAIAIPRHQPWATHHIVKSTKLSFSLDWMMDRYNPVVVMCRRHPLDVVASAVAMDHEYRIDWIAPRVQQWAIKNYGVSLPDPETPVTGSAWRIGLNMSRYNEALTRYPGILVVDHEVVCLDPVGEFRRIIEKVGLEWSPAVEDYINASNKPGTGYVLQRVASEQPGKWRKRLSPDDARAAIRVLSQFPIAERFALSDIEV